MGAKKHITEELDARLGPRLEESNFTTGHAITAYMAKERSSLKLRETTLRHCLAQNQEQEAAKKKEEKAAMKKEEQAAKKEEKAAKKKEEQAAKKQRRT